MQHPTRHPCSVLYEQKLNLWKRKENNNLSSKKFFFSKVENNKNISPFCNYKRFKKFWLHHLLFYLPYLSINLKNISILRNKSKYIKKYNYIKSYFLETWHFVANSNLDAVSAFELSIEFFLIDKNYLIQTCTSKSSRMG